MAHSPSSRRSSSRRDWWFDDLPPVGGWLRLLFYGGMLLLSLRNLKSPLAGTGFYAQTDPLLFRPYGLLEWLGVEQLPVSTVQWLTVLTGVAWAAAAVGWGGRLASIVTAFGALLLHGLFLGSNALNHYYFLPVYCLAAMCVAKPRPLGWPASRAEGQDRSLGVGDTGLARKLALFAAVGFYFAAGMSKLVNTGLAWADGETILYFCELRRGVYPLADLMLACPWIAQAGAIGTLILEVGAPLALLSRPLRHLWVVGILGMHIAIRYTMGPAYWPNVLCLALVVDWRWLWSLVKRQGVPQGVSNLAPRPRSVGRAIGVATLAVAFLPGTTATFWWPLTNVYMYCIYYSIDQDIRAGWPRLDFYRAESAQRIAQHYRETAPPREVAEYFAFRAALRLAGDEVEPQYLLDGKTLGVSTWKQLVLTVLAPVLIEDLSAKPAGQLDHRSPTEPLPAQRFLESYASVLKKRLPPELQSGYDRIELVWPTLDAEAGGASNAEPLPDPLRQEYATLEPNLPGGLRMTVLASVLLHDDAPTVIAEH